VAKVAPLNFFARFPISMGLVLELVQEIVAGYELWNRLENPTLSIFRDPDLPASVPRGLAAARLNRPIYAPLSRTPAASIPAAATDIPLPAAAAAAAAAAATTIAAPTDSGNSSAAGTPVPKTTGDKAADERVVDILVRMRKARERDLL
jgi:hypothetical protein